MALIPYLKRSVIISPRSHFVSFYTARHSPLLKFAPLDHARMQLFNFSALKLI